MGKDTAAVWRQALEEEDGSVIVDTFVSPQLAQSSFDALAALVRLCRVQAKQIAELEQDLDYWRRVATSRGAASGAE